MTILARNKISTHYSSPFSNEGSSIALSEAKRGDPSSTYFQYPNWLLPLTPFKLVTWLKECHYRAGLDFILPFRRHLRQAQKLVDNHGHDDLIRAVKQASLVAQHPFTFKFVGKVLNEES